MHDDRFHHIVEREGLAFLEVDLRAAHLRGLLGGGNLVGELEAAVIDFFGDDFHQHHLRERGGRPWLMLVFREHDLAGGRLDDAGLLIWPLQCIGGAGLRRIFRGFCHGRRTMMPRGECRRRRERKRTCQNECCETTERGNPENVHRENLRVTSTSSSTAPKRRLRGERRYSFRFESRSSKDSPRQECGAQTLVCDSKFMKRTQTEVSAPTEIEQRNVV